MSRPVRLLIAVLLFLFSLPISGYGPPTLVESGSSSTPVSPGVLRAISQDKPPAVDAKSAIVIDALTGEVVYEKDSHSRRAMASTTKIMTALVTLANASLDDVVTAGPGVRTVEPTIIGLDPGDRLTVEQILYGLLLPSGNDAAVALAEHVGGDIPGFAAMMNARSAELGLRDTHYSNPHGLDEDGQYSSAYDLAMLARAAMKEPVFERIVSTQEHRVKGPPMWLFRSSNRLLGTYSGADGVKTGYTDNAGRCLVFSATRGGRRAISVVLDSPSQWSEAASLLDYFFANYSWDTLAVGDSPLTSYPVGEETRKAVAKSQPQLVFPRWQEPYLRLFFDINGGTPPAGGLVGTVSYYLFGRKSGQIELLDGGA